MASPTDYRGSKPMDSQKKKKPIQSKSVHQKPQINTLKITKAKSNLKTKQQSKASLQKLDRSTCSPDSRAHHRSSEIARTSSEISPVQSTSSLGCSLSSLAPHRRSQIARCLSCSGAQCSMLDASSLKVFLSLFLSDSLSISH